MNPTMQLGERQWKNLKQRATQFGDRKNTPGKESSGTTERSAEYFKREGIERAVVPCVDEPATTPSEPGKGDLASE
jgi:hypothetical protein